ncbi:MAG: phosphate propanoyltransferase [Erysipelotrichaceae bacterium]|nr:phosphate propanoyltransferase [Erysipelotrichaceae bacterium]MCD8574131.1 phosphate propanoyltransferase [Erysipelotrichaceae bacterium]
MSKKDILVEISARHAHVTQKDLEILFGEGATLTPTKPLSQPGQFATAQKIDVVGPRNTLKGVTILGPVRSATQVEVAATEARTLGIKAPIRESGNVAGSAGATLIGPAGSIVIEEGVIVAKRHIHFSDVEAVEYNVQDKEVVMVKVSSDDRTLIFDDVVVRVHPNFKAAMHIDTDESNAAGISGEVMGEIIKK